MPELLGITDRILVMSNGLVAGIVETKPPRKTKYCVLRHCTFKIRGFT